MWSVIKSQTEQKYLERVIDVDNDILRIMSLYLMIFIVIDG